MTAILRTKAMALDGGARAEQGRKGPGSRMAKLRWWANRLFGMSGPEIAHRLGERIKQEFSARKNFAWEDFDPGDGLLPALPDVVLEGPLIPLLQPQWEKQADALASGEITVLGQAWPAHSGTDGWHLDPVTGRYWPSDLFCFKVPFRHDRSMGDAKYQWERNRLQYLQPIAALVKLRRDTTQKDICLAEINSWMEGIGLSTA